MLRASQRVAPDLGIGDLNDCVVGVSDSDNRGTVIREVLRRDVPYGRTAPDSGDTKEQAYQFKPVPYHIPPLFFCPLAPAVSKNLLACLLHQVDSKLRHYHCRFRQTV